MKSSLYYYQDAQNSQNSQNFLAVISGRMAGSSR